MEKKIFLADTEIEFDGSQECQNFIKTHAVSEKTAKGHFCALELIFQNGKLEKVFELRYDPGYPPSRYEKSLKEFEKEFDFIQTEPNRYYHIEKTQISESYIGGGIPIEFNLPKFNFIAPFQYLGKISKKDPAFAWLPFDLNLTAPIYLNFENLFLDYSNPNEPTFLNLEELKNTDTSYDDLKADSEIMYKKTPVKIYESKYIESEGIGNAGVPIWIQGPQIPVNPKTGKPLKFVCQFDNLYDAIPTEKHNIDFLKEPSFEKYFKHLNFWIGGLLYVFFDPDTKIACYLIQNS